MNRDCNLNSKEKATIFKSFQLNSQDTAESLFWKVNEICLTTESISVRTNLPVEHISGAGGKLMRKIFK